MMILYGYVSLYDQGMGVLVGFGAKRTSNVFEVDIFSGEVLRSTRVRSSESCSAPLLIAWDELL